MGRCDLSSLYLFHCTGFAFVLLLRLRRFIGDRELIVLPQLLYLADPLKRLLHHTHNIEVCALVMCNRVAYVRMLACSYLTSLLNHYSVVGRQAIQCVTRHQLGHYGDNTGGGAPTLHFDSFIS
jgi:hypothetical protein